MTLRVVIVDDEELARRGVRSRLENHGDVEVAAECATGSEAIAAIGRTRPDLVYLDVQLPGMSGFEVIAGCGPQSFPHVIFVTAHDRYAIRAFEVHALDYLLKPIDDERFDAALARARESLARDRQGDLARRLASLLLVPPSRSGGLEPGSGLDRQGRGGEPAPYPERFVVRSGGRVVFVRTAEVDWVGAAGDYVSLHVGVKSWLLRETMTAIERRLDPSRFARIHRSAIVNVERIAEMKAYDNGEFLVLLRNGKQLKLSRGYRHTLQRLIEGR